MSYYCRQVEELEQFMAGAKEQLYVDIKKELNNRPDRGCDVSDAMVLTTTKKKSTQPRAKESSKHFGVRFRPDLQKWVAEIRVAEWKSVDKKVWLGTFDSEEGAARAVDAARKLLNCKKKRAPNFPCDALRLYSHSIPPHLNLTNLGDDSMFKDVTLFVKRKAQEYAAAGVVSPRKASSSSSSSSLPISSATHSTPCSAHRSADSLITSDPGEPRFDASSSAEDVDVVCRYGICSHEMFPPCDGVDVCHWRGHPTSVHYDYSDEPPSCSTSAGTSPEDCSWFRPHAESKVVCYYGTSQALPSFAQALPPFVIQMDAADNGWASQSCDSMPSLTASMEIDDAPYPLCESSLWSVSDDLLFPFEGDLDQCHVQDQTVLDVFHRDEMNYVDAQNSDSWMFGPLLQQNFNMYYSMESYTPVC